MKDTITAEDEAIMDAKREEWIAVGLATGPTNREATLEGLRLAYAAADLPMPADVYWEPSPQAGFLKAKELTNGEVSLWDACWGYHDVGWLSFYDTFRAMGVEGLDAMDGMAMIARNAGWFWPFDEAVVVTDRPTEIHLDPQGNLHNADGPALLFSDGFALYSWHGTTVPADMIETDWTPEQIMREQNAEVRRSAIEKMGWPEFIEAMGMTQVGSDQPDPGNPGQVLSLYDIPEDIYEEPVRVLLCVNGTVERDGTRRRFGLTVPASCESPLEAAAWGYGIPTDEYVLLDARK